MTAIALPADLHRRLSEAAAARQRSLMGLVRELLAAELTVAQARRAAGHSLSDFYLTDPRLAKHQPGSPITQADSDQLHALDDLLAACREELGANVPRAYLLQGMLWQALDPLPPGAERAPLPASAKAAHHLTVAIPAALNTAVRELALRRGQRVEPMLAELLERALEEAKPADLAQDDRSAAPVGRGSSTVHVPRSLDGQLTTLARTHFGGVKSRAIQALLWWSLDQLSQQAAVTDRVLTLDGSLYAAIEQHLRGRRAAGDERSVPAFVEEAVRALLAQEQAHG